MKLKLFWSFVFIWGFINSLSAITISVNQDNLRYAVDDVAMTAEVYGPVSSSTTITNLVIPDYIDYNGSQIPVISIRDHAFGGLTVFTGNLIIGDNVQAIGEGAFSGCKGFIGSLTIPNSVQTIGDYAFNRCSGFSGSLTIPNSVQTIGTGAFFECFGFNGALIIGNNVQTIGEYAFYKCSGFTGSLTIPNSVQTIGRSAFSGCSGFTGSLTIGDSVKTIGQSAFWGCSFTGDLIIGNSLTTLESDSGFPPGFKGKLVIGNSVTSIGNSAFTNFSFTGDLIIPNSVTSIGGRAFSGCSGFTGSLTIPNSVQTIGYMAFHGCSGFNGSLTIGNSVQTIGESAFYKCSGFNGDLVLGENVEDIGTWNFYDSNFKSVTSWNTTPPSCGGRNFENIYTTAPLYVPVESVNAYKTAFEWKNFFNIQGIGTEIPATGIELNMQDLILKVGQTDKLIATVSPENTTDQTITWKSDNEAVATVAADGIVTAVSAGVANITASCGDASATCKVTVNPVVDTGITLNVQDMTLTVGQTDKLTATVTPPNTTDQTITWTSDNAAVATVAADGTVTAISVGVVNITASCGDASATCKVTVNPVTATGITLNVQDMTLTVGQTDKLTATVTPPNTTDQTITWKSDNEAIATVATDGTVTAVSVGVANITASCGDASATCKVTVNPVTATGITLNVQDMTLTVGQTDKLTATVTPPNTTDKTIIWTSSNPGVATVSTDGTVSGMSAGTASITATCGSVSASCQVTVIQPVSIYGTAETPDQLLRKGNGTSCTFIAMMPISDSQMESRGYKLVYGYDNATAGSQVLDNTALRYTHTASAIYNDPANDFWVFAYFYDNNGDLCVSYRRHLDGSTDDDFDPETLISVTVRSVGEEITGIYTTDGRYMGKDIEALDHGIYIIKTTTSSTKIVK